MKKLISIILFAIIATTCAAISANAKSIKVTAPKLKSVTNTDIDRQKIKWSKVKSVKGYQLYCKIGSGKFKKIKTFGKNTTSFVNKKLTAGKKYFYKIRAYKKVNGKTRYSKFSGQLGKKCTNYLIDLYRPYNAYYTYTYYTSGNYFNMGGEKYSNGFTMCYGDAFSTFNVKGKYKYLTLTVGIIDGNTNGGTFNIYSDDSCVASYEIKDNSLPQNYRVNIEYANKLEFKYSTNRYIEFGFANIKLYK